MRELHPLPAVPDVIEPLGPEPKTPRGPTWQEYVSSLAPPVRELRLGERPRDWTQDACVADLCYATKGVERGGDEPRVEHVRPESEPEAELEPEPEAELEPERRQVRPPLTGPQQYQVQFSTTEEHVQLVERAKALLARQAPGQSLGELHLQAMRLLVAALEKQKFAVTERPRKATKSSSAAEPAAREPVEPPRQRERQPEGQPERGRHVPAAVRRAVFERDGARCTYRDERGKRCRETHNHELHHREPIAMGGPPSTANLTLHCQAHNAHAAELDFGRGHMAVRRDALSHEALSLQQPREATQRASDDG